ncbi:MAG: SDR family oxidoreductase [Acidobacteria bacterium]|nr:SDR family oxidoreductase [Acidobacteriota bacterium]
MILVTGAGGTVGSEVLRQLRQRGAAVRAGFHSPKKAEHARAQGSDAVVLDFADRASIAAALKGVDKVFLLGATVSNQSELEINVVEEAKKAGVGHIVKLSVLGAPSEKLTFARWHHAAEKAIEKSGVAYTFLRANEFMQNFVTYYGDTIRSQGAFYLPTRDARVSLIDVRDIAAVAVEALTQAGHEGKAYELTGPEALSNAELAQKLSAAVGRAIQYVDIPPEAFKQGALAGGIPEFYVDALTDLYRFYVEEGAQHLSGDVEKVTGGKPRNFDDFAREHASAFRSAAA